MNIMHKNEIFLNRLFTFGKRCINIEKAKIKIDNIKAGEEKEIQFNYKAQEVKNVSVYVTENEPEILTLA